MPPRLRRYMARLERYDVMLYIMLIFAAPRYGTSRHYLRAGEVARCLLNA